MGFIINSEVDFGLGIKVKGVEVTINAEVLVKKDSGHSKRLREGSEIDMPYIFSVPITYRIPGNERPLLIEREMFFSETVPEGNLHTFIYSKLKEKFVGADITDN